MARSTLLIGNWKMNLTPREATSFAQQLRASLLPPRATEVWVAPMTICLADVARELRDSPVSVGAQNVHWATHGAFTGETSARAAADLDLRFSLVGHSERRTHFGDTSETVALRMKAALLEGLTPVVCIGETDAERTSAATERVLEAQLAPIFAQLDPDTARKMVLAYEPVWAIGTGKVASEKEIRDTHGYIHDLWRQQGFGCDATVLYGGSVSPENFQGIVALPGVHGALVGGASIKLDQWLRLIQIAEESAD